MDFSHTEERRILAETVRRFLADNYTVEFRHNATASETGFSRDIWRSFADLGLIGALFQEQDGGLGGSGHDIAVLFEELGRALVIEPFLATLLGGTAIALSGNDEQKLLLEQIISGDRYIAFAHGEPDSRYNPAHVSTTAAPNDDGWILNGRKAVVLNGHTADRLVVSARTAGSVDDETGLTLFLVMPDQNGVSIRGYPTVDGLHAAELEFVDVAVPASAILGQIDTAYDFIERTIGFGVLALSAEALGAMELAKEMTLEYLQTRSQFGRPIGKFQSLQHRMADILMEVEQMRSAVINAASRSDASGKEREWALSAAKHMAGTVGRLVAEEAIQLHGGIGMTWEYPLAHYAKRLVMIDHMLGDADHHLERAVSLTHLPA